MSKSDTVPEVTPADVCSDVHKPSADQCPTQMCTAPVCSQTQVTHAVVNSPASAANVNTNTSHASTMLQSDEVSVRASHSQTHSKYDEMSNKQGAANAAVFLAFLNENTDLSTSDLNLVLDKGAGLYCSLEPTVGHEYLVADQIPDEIEGKSHLHRINKKQTVSGLFTDCTDPDIPDLETSLNGLFTNEKYGILTMANSSIAVFRDDRGMFGFFDAGPRNEYGQ